MVWSIPSWPALMPAIRALAPLSFPIVSVPCLVIVVNFDFSIHSFLWAMGPAMKLDRVGRRIKMRQLEILSAVAECGTMGKASQQLSISQPVVSKAIADLERMLGVRLLDRRPEGTEPTQYGRALLKRSAVIFDELKEGVSEI